MKRILACLLSIGSLVSPCFTAGWNDGHVIFKGQYVESEVVTVPTHTATALGTKSVTDLETRIYNYSSFILWVGSNTSTLATTGFPIPSSGTVVMDGQFVGQLYGLADSAAGGDTDARILHLKRYIP